MTLSVGATIRSPYGDRYVIEGHLGKGGFGAVYLVRDRHDRQHLFALKEVLNPNKRERERFIFEGEILKRLDHRALPHVYKVFAQDKSRRMYMLMDYIQGTNLETLRNGQPGKSFSPPLMLDLMKPIVEAVIYLHAQDPPIVHKDIKPGNIIVPTKDDETVLVDFGSAKEYIEDETTSVIRHGSPGYAALEQYGSGTTPRTDIYGLGATMYALLTGVIPPDAVTRATGSRGLDPLESAHLITPGVPSAVAMALEHAMSISSDDRFATVEEFWQELTAHVPQQVQKSARDSFNMSQLLTVPEQTFTPASLQHQNSSKRRILLPISLIFLLSIFIGTGLLFYTSRNTGPSSNTQRNAHPFVTTTSQSELPSAVVSATSKSSLGVPLYPSLAVSYGGTALDLLAKEKTAIFLTHIQQNQGNIQGYFQGLGQVGPFKGTITPSGHVQFKVPVQASKTTLFFEGDIKIAGDMTGNFEVLNQQGQQIGEYGLWNVAANH
ncbi:MAG: serine/threonine protein kinase [Chloroflexota bacterium]|nr:serine/threonine protein kinase [Chloroflexota bacterium]